MCSLTGDPAHSERAANEHTVSEGLGILAYENWFGSQALRLCQEGVRADLSYMLPSIREQITLLGGEAEGLGAIPREAHIAPTDTEGAQGPICQWCGVAVLVCRQVDFLGGLQSKASEVHMVPSQRGGECSIIQSYHIKSTTFRKVVKTMVSYSFSFFN